MLDLFSGTGNIGFEFASRGTEKVITIDNNRKCIDFIKTTANKFKLNVFSVQSDAITYTKNCKEKFNFIFADPPYNYEKYEELKEIIIARRMNTSSQQIKELQASNLRRESIIVLQK